MRACRLDSSNGNGFHHGMPRVPSPLLLVAVGTALAASGCGRSTPAAPAAAGAVRVVAGENFWGNITAQIGGSHVQVTSIITDPNADPHTYETDPKDAAAISEARFVVLNGVGYDDFAQRLLPSHGSTGRVVLTMEKVLQVSGSNPNPHLWYSPTYVTAGARVIESQLARTDPTDAPAFASGLARFLAAYQPYVDTLAEIKAKYGGTRVAYTERVPGYLLQAAGLILGTPASFAQAIEDGNDPSPGDTAAIDEAMSHHTVKVLLYNAQVTSPVTAKVQELARDNRIPVVGVAETIPSGYATFQAWQIAQADAVLRALGG
jgi:zinc/manganese transport system substrate-binding protein